MPSELQRVARGLVDCFDEIPRVVDHLLRTAARCRENAQVALIASRGQATVAAQQLDAAARACEAAAHFLSMAPPKARTWAEALTGPSGRSTNRPSSDSADRNKLTSGTGLEIRTRRLVVDYEEVEVAEDNEPPLITVARKAFEQYRKTHEKDAENEAPDPLELEITVTETGEVIFEEPDKKEDEKREDRLTRDFDFDPALAEAVKSFLETLPEDHQWEHLTLTITPDHLELTFDTPEPQPPAPLVVDIQLPDLSAVEFDPAVDLRPLDVDFAPGVYDPQATFKPHEAAIANRLAEEGWRIDARKANHGSGDKNPDVTVRKSPSSRGVIVEFKTPQSHSNSAVKRNMNGGSGQSGHDGEVVIDGRPIGLTEEGAERAFRRACGQPGSRVARMVHVILGDGRMVSYAKES